MFIYGQVLVRLNIKWYRLLCPLFAKFNSLTKFILLLNNIAESDNLTRILKNQSEKEI